MNIRMFGPRMGLVVSLFAVALLGSGCEDDTIAPTNRPDPPTCEEDDRYCNVSGRLDLGVRTDSGTTDPADAGLPAGDSGLHDTGAPDLGNDPPDSGVVDSGPPPQFIDIAGTHDVYYQFDWSDALFGINNLAGPVRSILAALRGNLQGVLEDELGLDSAIAFLIASAIPANTISNFVQQIEQNVPWLLPLLDIIDVIGTFFENVEVKGALTITHGAVDNVARTRALSGSDVWSKVYVHIIQQCPPSYTPTQVRATGCDLLGIDAVAMTPPPPSNPNQPRPLAVRVEAISPFIGVQQEGLGEADFEFSNPRREADIDVRGLVLLVIDAVTRAVTANNPPQYQTFRAALQGAINCAGLAAQLTSNIVYQQLIEDGCIDLIDNTVDSVFGVSVGWNIIEFDQFGRAVDTDADNRANYLQNFAADDRLDGRVRTLGSEGLGGRWCAPRGLNHPQGPMPNAACPNPP